MIYTAVYTRNVVVVSDRGTIIIYSIRGVKCMAHEMILESIIINENFNFSIQSFNKVVTQYYDSVYAFKLKLSLWKTQLVGGDAVHFTCLKNVCTTQRVADMKRFKDKLTGLLQEFEQVCAV